MVLDRNAQPRAERNGMKWAPPELTVPDVVVVDGSARRTSRRVRRHTGENEQGRVTARLSYGESERRGQRL